MPWVVVDEPVIGSLLGFVVAVASRLRRPGYGAPPRPRFSIPDRLGRAGDRRARAARLVASLQAALVARAVEAADVAAAAEHALLLGAAALRAERRRDDEADRDHRGHEDDAAEAVAPGLVDEDAGDEEGEDQHANGDPETAHGGTSVAVPAPRA